MDSMNGTITVTGASTVATPDALRDALASGEFFWLDLIIGTAEAVAEAGTVLTDSFHFHDLAVRASIQFGQRARIDDYPEFAHIVTFGMAADGLSEVEVHCYVTATNVVTLHTAPCPALESIGTRASTQPRVANLSIALVYLILDSLVDSFFPVMSTFDDAIDTLAAAILVTPTEEQLGQIFDLKKRVLAIRRVIAPQRDMISSINAGVVTLPGWTADGAAYFRNLYDHLIRIGDMVDGYRDLLSGVMDTHLSMVSNRLNLVMKQLAVIATVFLPLGFLTGFFGQNFAWLQAHTQATRWEFLGWGLGTEAIAIALLMILFKRRGWLGSGPTA
jgi:magnesium transporter